MNDKIDILDPNVTDPEKYMAGRVKEYIADIEYIAKHGTNDDSTKLKACTVLLNKIMPDRTKMDVDIKNQAPYEILMKQLKGE